VHELRSVVSALRQMSQARHVGKVVVRSGGGGNSLAEQQQQQQVDGAVLVLGGTGTLGCLMVRWLAEQGVRHIPVASRTGKLSGGIAEVLAGSAAAQAQVSVLQCDASSVADVQALLAGGPPLLAVLHAGGVLADATFGNQTLRDLRAVSAPKVAALQNLQQLLQLQPLATAVLFSSVASLLGAPGQANYSAANAALDAAAMRSQQAGTPMVSVQWGAWAGAGMAASDAQTAARVERTGMGLLSPEAGLAALEGVLAGLGAGAAGAAVPGEWPGARCFGPACPVGLLALFQPCIAATRHPHSPPMHPPPPPLQPWWRPTPSTGTSSCPASRAPCRRCCAPSRRRSSRRPRLQPAPPQRQAAAASPRRPCAPRCARRCRACWAAQ
jgi:hypothetical protein